MDNPCSHGYALLIGVGASAYAPWSLPVTVKDVQALRDIPGHWRRRDRQPCRGEASMILPVIKRFAGFV